MRDLQSRLKLAEITGSIGAGVIGAGLGVFFGSTFYSYWLPILLVGIFVHSWAMYDKHVLEVRAHVVRPWWSGAIYWLCWFLILCGLVLLIIQFS